MSHSGVEKIGKSVRPLLLETESTHTLKSPPTVIDCVVDDDAQANEKKKTLSDEKYLAILSLLLANVCLTSEIKIRCKFQNVGTILPQSMPMTQRNSFFIS